MKAAYRTLLYQLFALFLALPPAFAEEAPLAEVPLFSQAELDQMLAPIALYPDQLLSQMLMAATYPLEIVQAARWSRANPGLNGEAAVRAVDTETWDPSVKAMVAFPEILGQMDADLDWTGRLGDAFLAQQTQLMDSVQELRRRAGTEGNLSSNEQVEVLEQGPTIVVRQVQPEVVYVPYYDPYRVYGNWWWADYRPVRWAPWPGYYPRYGYNGFHWGPGIFVGNGFFYGDYDWYHHDVRVVHRPPFYYHRPPPPRYRWVHDSHHRRGVPYRSLQLHRQYAGGHARPPRVDHADSPYRANREQPAPRGVLPDRADLERTASRAARPDRIPGSGDQDRAPTRQPRGAPDRTTRESAYVDRAQRTFQRAQRSGQELAGAVDQRERTRPDDAGPARQGQPRRDPQAQANATRATPPAAAQRIRPNADQRAAGGAPRAGSAFAARGQRAQQQGISRGFAPQAPAPRAQSQPRAERRDSPRSAAPARESADRGGQRQQSWSRRD